MFSLFYLLVKTTKRDFGNIKHAEIKQVLSFKQVSVTLSNFLNRKNKKQEKDRFQNLSYWAEILSIRLEVLVIKPLSQEKPGLKDLEFILIGFYIECIESITFAEQSIQPGSGWIGFKCPAGGFWVLQFQEFINNILCTLHARFFSFQRFLW